MINWQVIQGDSLEVMRGLPAVGACITDPPYGTTACSWDSVIPFGPMWTALKRVVKPSGAIVLFGSQPFTSALVMSNPGMFKYQWVWDKKQAGVFLNAKAQPLRVTEDIAVFGAGVIDYHPEMKKGRLRFKGGAQRQPECTGEYDFTAKILSEDYYPTNLLEFANSANKGDRVHPTEKPEALMRYLIRTYTNPGETVLDFTCGSGTTGVACAIEGRNFIGIEQDVHYCDVARARITRACGQYAEIPRRAAADVLLPLFAA